MKKVLEDMHRILQNSSAAMQSNTMESFSQGPNSSRQQYHLRNIASAAQEDNLLNNSRFLPLPPRQFHNKENIDCYESQNQCNNKGRRMNMSTNSSIQLPEHSDNQSQLSYSSRRNIESNEAPPEVFKRPYCVANQNQTQPFIARRDRPNYENIQCSVINTNSSVAFNPDMSMLPAIKSPISVQIIINDLASSAVVMEYINNEMELPLECQLNAAEFLIKFKRVLQTLLMAPCSSNASMISTNSLSIAQRNYIHNWIYGEESPERPVPCSSADSNFTSISAQGQPRLGNRLEVNYRYRPLREEMAQCTPIITQLKKENNELNRIAFQMKEEINRYQKILEQRRQKEKEMEMEICKVQSKNEKLQQILEEKNNILKRTINAQKKKPNTRNIATATESFHNKSCGHEAKANVPESTRKNKNNSSVLNQSQECHHNILENKEPFVLRDTRALYSSEDNCTSSILNNSIITRSVAKAAKNLVATDKTFKIPKAVELKGSTVSVKSGQSSKTKPPVKTSAKHNESVANVSDSPEYMTSMAVSSRGRRIIPTKNYWESGSNTHDVSKLSAAKAVPQTPVVGKKRNQTVQGNKSEVQTAQGSSDVEKKAGTKTVPRKTVLGSKKPTTVDKTLDLGKKSGNQADPETSGIEKKAGNKGVKRKPVTKQTKSKESEDIDKPKKVARKKGATESVNSNNSKKRKPENSSSTSINEKRKKTEHDDSFMNISISSNVDSFFHAEGQNMFNPITPSAMLNSVRRNAKASTSSGRETPPLMALTSFLDQSGKSHTSGNATLHELNAVKNYVAERVTKKKEKSVPQGKKTSRPKKPIKSAVCNPKAEKLLDHISKSNGGIISKLTKDQSDSSADEEDSDSENDDYIDLA